MRRAKTAAMIFFWRRRQAADPALCCLYEMFMDLIAEVADQSAYAVHIASSGFGTKPFRIRALF